MVAVLDSETPNTTQVPFGCSMPSAVPTALPPTESRISQNGPCGLAAASSRPTTTRSPHHSATAARCCSRLTCPQTKAPAAAASWQAKCPTPPEAPSTNTLRPSNSPPWRSACSAVSPATGRVAACASVTASGTTATAWLGARTRSAQAPDGRRPTTRLPTGGPLPLAARSSTIPAKSQPGRSPGVPCDVARLTSPRFNEIAVTRTVTSSGLAGANSTGLTASPCALDGSTITARTVSGMGAYPYPRLALNTVKATLDFVYQCNRLAAQTNG